MPRKSPAQLSRQIVPFTPALFLSCLHKPTYISATATVPSSSPLSSSTMESHKLIDNSSKTATSSSSSPFDSFKSKKILRSTSKPESSSSSSTTTKPSDPNTPKKAVQLRTRNRTVVFSVNHLKNTLKKKASPDQLGLIGPSSQLTKRSPAKRKARDSPNLPERFEVLAKLFENMQLTIRLLQLKRTMRSFTNICPGVESLSERRFTYTHLAQMKYVLPEAIELKKITLVEPQTCCTKSDLEVSLVLDAIEFDGKGKMGYEYSNLSKVFWNRLLEFVKTHPEEVDVPMGELPEPFNKRIQNDVLSSKQIQDQRDSSSPVHSSSDVPPQQSSVAACHLSRSFKTRFTQKVPISQAEKTQLLSTNPNSSSQLEKAGSSIPSTLNIFPKLPTVSNTTSLDVAAISDTPKSIKSDAEEAKVPNNTDCSPKEILQSDGNLAKLTSTPRHVSDAPKKAFELCDKEVRVMENNDCSLKDVHSVSTPAKSVSTPARLMASTPALQTPKRSRIVQNDACTPSPNKLARRPPKRPLFNSPVKKTKSEEEKKELETSSSDSYLINLLPEALRHSLMEKEKETTKKQEIAISQAKWRKQMVACLPKLFNMIHLMFQSVKGSVITKDELMHKIITRHIDLVDRAELEEQLKLLKELVPDWIQEKVASSGDVLFCVNKRSCADLVRKRLTEAYKNCV